MEVTIESFFTNLFQHPPQPPFSFAFEVDGATSESLSVMLGEVLLSASKSLYDRLPHELAETQMATLREYYQSFGFDIEYAVKECSKEVTDYNPDGTPFKKTISYPDYQILFKRASNLLMPGPDRLL